MSRHVSSKRKSRPEKYREASPVSSVASVPCQCDRCLKKDRHRHKHIYHHNSSGYLTADSGYHRQHRHRTLHRPVGYDYHPMMVDHGHSRRLLYHEIPPPYYYDLPYNSPHNLVCTSQGHHPFHSSPCCNNNHHHHQHNDCYQHNNNNCCNCCDQRHHVSGCDLHNNRSCCDNQPNCCDHNVTSCCNNHQNACCTNQCQECSDMTGCKLCLPHMETKTTGIQTDLHQHHHMGVQTEHKHNCHHHDHIHQPTQHQHPVQCEICMNYSKVLEKILPAPERAYRLIAPPRPPSDMHAKLRIAKGKDNVKVYTIEKQRGPFKSYEKIHSTLNDEL